MNLYLIVLFNVFLLFCNEQGNNIENIPSGSLLLLEKLVLQENSHLHVLLLNHCLLISLSFSLVLPTAQLNQEYCQGLGY